MAVLVSFVGLDSRSVDASSITYHRQSPSLREENKRVSAVFKARDRERGTRRNRKTMSSVVEKVKGREACRTGEEMEEC